jgi:hypothetical protein
MMPSVSTGSTRCPNDEESASIVAGEEAVNAPRQAADLGILDKFRRQSAGYPGIARALDPPSGRGREGSRWRLHVRATVRAPAEALR